MIRVNLEKAKGLSHATRRAKREQEFAPYDEMIAKQIPGKSAQEAEASRAAIRSKYDSVQRQIDAARDVETLKAILSTM